MKGFLSFEEYRQGLSPEQIKTIVRDGKEIKVFDHPKDERFFVEYEETPDNYHEWKLILKTEEDK